MRSRVITYFAIGLLLAGLLVMFKGASTRKQTPPRIELKEAHQDGIVRVQITNVTKQAVFLWQTSNSWGHGNWMFHFYNGPELIVYVPNPTQEYAKNAPQTYKIMPSASLELSFDLKKDYISHHIPIALTELSGTGEAAESKGWMAVFFCPASPESKKFQVWTGVNTSPLLQK